MRKINTLGFKLAFILVSSIFFSIISQAQSSSNEATLRRLNSEIQDLQNQLSVVVESNHRGNQRAVIGGRNLNNVEEARRLQHEIDQRVGKAGVTGGKYGDETSLLKNEIRTQGQIAKNRVGSLKAIAAIGVIATGTTAGIIYSPDSIGKARDEKTAAPSINIQREASNVGASNSFVAGTK